VVTARIEAALLPVEMMTLCCPWQATELLAGGGPRFGQANALTPSKANDGKILVSLDLSEINHKPMPARSRLGGTQEVAGYRSPAADKPSNKLWAQCRQKRTRRCGCLSTLWVSQSGGFL
jgi:hypothetical protein